MKIRATVCELPNHREAFDDAWNALCAHTTSSESDLVVLPEMPFSKWLASTRVADETAWAAAVGEHSNWIWRLPELNARWVIATRPIVEPEGAFNEGFVWTEDSEDRGVHSKRNLPDEPGFWEASWYQPGSAASDVYRSDELTLGFAICTELWFFDRARRYGEEGVQIVVSPRATLMPSREKWLAGGRASATVSGAYSLSSNFSGPAMDTGEWGGYGWIIEPEEGEVLGVTSSAEPFVTREIELDAAVVAKRSYPRYVKA